MPEPHNPERTPDGEQHHFSPSVPDLRPNLGEYQTVGTGNPDQGLATHFENNELGDEASDFRTTQAHHAERAKIGSLEQVQIQGEAETAAVGVKALEEALRDTNDSTEQHILTNAIRILERREDGLRELAQLWAEAVDEHGLINAKNEIMARNHYRKHEEAYKNQAVNDARRAGVDVNYPPYTDQEPPAPPEPPASPGPEQFFIH